jgi:hypothetical protein
MAFENSPAQDYVFSSHSSLLKANASSQEQKFIENLVVESIEIYGQDIYYVPRTLVNRDTVFGEDSDSTFDSARAIRAYVNNVEGWEGQGELLSKFGIRVEDKTTFIFSREKFTEKVDDLETLIVEGRPNEGDLIWFPITKHLFEIKFVEVERPFYQLGRNFVWECQCELFEYSDEELDTGVTEIDAIETTFANAIKLVMDAGGSGDFTVGEDVVGDQFLAAATATQSGGVVQSVTITDGGGGYKSATPPTVTFSASTQGAVNAGTITVSGAGHTTGQVYNTTGGSGTGLTIQGTGGGGLIGFTIVNAGSGYQVGDIVQTDIANPASIEITGITNHAAATGTATVDSAGLVTGITITSGGTGYSSAPTVTIANSPKDVRAEVKSWNSSTRELQLINRSGTFNTAETVRGETSGALWSPESYNTLNNVNSEFDQNYTFETEDDDIIDFTETNPFGTIGSTTDDTI